MDPIPCITTGLVTLSILEEEYAALEEAEERSDACKEILQGTQATIAECMEVQEDDAAFDRLQRARFLEEGLLANERTNQERVKRLRVRVSKHVEGLLSTIAALLQSEDAQKADPTGEGLRSSVLLLTTLYERPIRETVDFIRTQLHTYRLSLSVDG